jgi:hypothetical protein
LADVANALATPKAGEKTSRTVCLWTGIAYAVDEIDGRDRALIVGTGHGETTGGRHRLGDQMAEMGCVHGDQVSGFGTQVV